VLAMIFALLLSACAPAATPSGGESPSGDSSAAAEPAAKGGDLIIAFPASSEPASLDGHIDPYQPTWLFNSFVSDPLVVLSPNGEFLPSLATGWESNAEGTMWTFTLRQGVTFQDGTPFNAEAVKYNLERIKAPETASVQMAADLGPVESIEVVDEFTIQINYSEPWVTLLDAARRMPLWSPTAAAQYSVTEFDRHLVGTGPFLLDEWRANDRIIFKKWEEYGGWNPIQNHEGPAYLDSVTILFIGEAAVLGSVVSSGVAHIARELPPVYREDYQNSTEYQFITGFQAGTGLQQVVNVRNAPLNILELRQALLYAVDQFSLNDLLYDGAYLEQKGPVNVKHPCYWDGVEAMYPYDIEKSKELLESIGYRDEDGDGIREAYGVEGVEDGTPLTIRWTTLHHVEIGEAMQAQWRLIGVDLKVEQVAGPIQIDMVNTRNFDLIYERQRSPDPMILDMIWNSRWDQPGGWAWTGFKDEELDSLVGQLRVVGDFNQRCEIAAQAQEIIMANALMIPTLSQPVFYALNQNVMDFQLASEGNYFYLHNTYIEE
jgi:peptide/nickel transport system substrate-binding protein